MPEIISEAALWLLYIYLAGTLVYWVCVLGGVWLTTRYVPRLVDVEFDEPAVWPKVSVIAAARNEARTVEQAAASRMELDYPDLQLVLIDDRSTDGTGEAVGRVAAADDRVAAVHIEQLPEGWLGKVHALHRGTQVAEAQWLLFTDADVHLEPRTLRQAIGYCEQHGLDHLAAIPEMWSVGLLLDATLDVFFRTLCLGMQVWSVPNPRSSAFIGVGAFNLVRRSALEKTEGFPWLRMEVADDVGLGMMLKRSGARSQAVNGVGLVGLRWYHSLDDLARGAEKGYASLARCRVWRLVAATGLMIAVELAPLAALAFWFVPAAAVCGGMMLALALASTAWMNRWMRRPPWRAALWWLAVPVTVVVLMRVAWLGFRRGGIDWRGTRYDAQTLREGARVKLL